MKGSAVFYILVFVNLVGFFIGMGESDYVSMVLNVLQMIAWMLIASMWEQIGKK